MIGDWVQCVDSTHEEKTYAQIDAIEEGQTCILVRKDNCNWFLDIGFIEAIPLTAEILDKNFEQDEYDDYSYYEINDEFCIRNAYGSIFLAQWTDSEYSLSQYPKFIINLESVEQLQHALRLCGVDKEIVL